MQKKIKFTLVAASIALLAACGGGGDDVSVTSVDAQGFWFGPATTGYDVSAIVLENKEVWGVYTSGGTIYGALYGTAAVSGSNITVTGTDFNFVDNSSSAGVLNGTVVAKSTLSLSNTNTSVSLAYKSEYDTPATAAAIEGSWTFVGRSGNFDLVPGEIAIDSSGNFSLNQTDCVTSGSFTPRSGGKNVYNISLTSAGVGCAIGYSTLAGVAYLDTTLTPNRFVSLGLTPSKDDGLIVIGTKQAVR